MKINTGLIVWLGFFIYIFVVFGGIYFFCYVRGTCV